MAEYQLSLADMDEDGEYRAFVEKFRPKKTTDDCMTPPAVYDAVAEWVAAEYGVSREDFVRPFWPGGDYQRYDYPGGCVVVDNPPFSIITEIGRFYVREGIRFFLFAPALTLFTAAQPESVCALAVGVGVVYENGAEVKTSFLTNMDGARVRTAPGLYRAVDAACRGISPAANLPVYDYPDTVINAPRIQKFARWGIEFTVPRGEAFYIRTLEAMDGKGIFGGGFLISEKAAAEKAAAEKAAAEKAAAEKKSKTIWELSEREKRIVEKLKKS